MSRVDELIEEFCPDGVEFRNLENCCCILDKFRKPVTKSARVPGPYPYYGANGIQDYVSEYLFDGTFVLVGEDGSVITEFGKPVVNWAKGKIWVNNHAHIVKESEGVLLRYLFHCLLTVDVHDLIHGNIPKLNQADFRQIKIPVPPLPVQEEIVRILDTFTDLEAELEAELEAREKQYEYYRDQLLTLNKPTGFKRIDQLMAKLCPKGVTFKQLKDVCIIKKGTQLNKDKLKDEGSYPVINGGISPSGCWDEFNFSANLITISQGGASAGFVNFIETPFWAGAHCYVISRCIDSVDYRYLYHFVKQQQKTFQQKKIGAGIPGLALKEVNELLIPAPPLPVQKEIVQILDAFTELETKLETELEARKQQYEYYRDKLLTFKELKA